jgi:hypothetical protein
MATSKAFHSRSLSCWRQFLGGTEAAASALTSSLALADGVKLLLPDGQSTTATFARILALARGKLVAVNQCSGNSRGYLQPHGSMDDPPAAREQGLTVRRAASSGGTQSDTLDWDPRGLMRNVIKQTAVVMGIALVLFCARTPGENYR